MSDSRDIVVEVIVWNGIDINPFGHVTTKITKNGIIYSYSLEREAVPNKVCNTEAFKKLRRHEEAIRDGFGFVLNITQKQAREIFLSMQARFHSYHKRSCVYNAFIHNCTYAIQIAMKKAGIHLYHDISKIPIFQVSGVQTILPAYIEEGLLKTRNGGNWLVNKIIQYKKGQNKGEIVCTTEPLLLDLGLPSPGYDKLNFNLTAIHSQQGWYTQGEPNKSSW